jgi:hypothetical protein
MTKHTNLTRTDLLKETIWQYRKELAWTGAALGVLAIVIHSAKNSSSGAIATYTGPSYDLYQFSALTEYAPDLLPKITDLVSEYNVQDLITFTI